MHLKMEIIKKFHAENYLHVQSDFCLIKSKILNQVKTKFKKISNDFVELKIKKKFIFDKKY